VRVQICLIGQVRDAELSDVVTDERERDDQGDQAGAVVRDELGALGALVAAELALEESSQVLEHVGVARARRARRPRLGEQSTVVGGARARGDSGRRLHRADRRPGRRRREVKYRSDIAQFLTASLVVASEKARRRAGECIERLRRAHR
jgi:hypothetical protein